MCSLASGSILNRATDVRPGGSDFAPTAAHRAVYAELKSQLTATRAKYDKLISTDLAAFNSMLGNRGVGGIIR